MVNTQMAIKIFKEKNTIGFLLTGYIKTDEFVQVIHNIELLCQEHSDASVLFETTGLKDSDFKIDLKDFDLYKKYWMRLKKIAVVHEGQTSPFIVEEFRDFGSTDIKIFGDDQIEQARKWTAI